MKKQWEQPELIVISRSTPEENVLAHCKFNKAGLDIGDKQTTSGHGCQADVGGCGACQDLGGKGS